jgi:hypothetical protein
VKSHGQMKDLNKNKKAMRPDDEFEEALQIGSANK